MNEQALLAAIGSMMEEKLEAGLKPIKEDIAGLKEDVSGLQAEVVGIKEEVSELKTEVVGIKGEVSELKTEVVGIKGEVSELKTEVAEIKGRLDKIEDRLDKVEEQTGRIEMQATRLGVIVENEVDRAVKLLGEGHEGILETIKRDFASAEELEKDRIRLFSLEETARKHTRQIENLQKRTG